jgi:hypothetical protein
MGSSKVLVVKSILVCRYVDAYIAQEIPKNLEKIACTSIYSMFTHKVSQKQYFYGMCKKDSYLWYKIVFHETLLLSFFTLATKYIFRKTLCAT